jgi:uncharacterized protein YdeI (YjbR/CyaY-like superfamily)
MPENDPKIDAHIAKAQPFAKPILIHIRELVRKTCPDIEEKMKWNFPHFDYQREMMCRVATFKQHAIMGFWKAALMKDKRLTENAQSEVSMGHMGRLTGLKDLPSDTVMIGYIKEAMKLNDEGVKLPPRAKPIEHKELAIPNYFKVALKKVKKAQAAFEAFPPSHRKEYIIWLQEAKTEETRENRLAQAIEWIAESKSRNWKYMKK